MGQFPRDTHVGDILEMNGQAEMMIRGKSAFRLIEVAAQTGMSVSLLRTRIRAGELRAKKLGSTVFVLPEDLSDFLNRCEDWTPGEAPAAANAARRSAK